MNTILDGFALNVGQSKMLRVLVDMQAANVDGLTATNAEEVRAIVDNWKLKTSPAAITINLAHPSTYDLANESKASAENIVMDGLDLSDIPANLTLIATDTIAFTGVTNLKSTKAITTTADVELAGTTTLGAVTIGNLIVSGETTVNGAVTATTNVTIAADAELTIANLNSVLTAVGLINKGTVNIISNGKVEATTITNYVQTGATENTTVLGTINVGDQESVGTLKATTVKNANNTKLATIRFFNGTVNANVTDGYYVAVASDAMTFAQAIAAKVLDIEVIGEIKFATVTADASDATIYLKEGAVLNLGNQGNIVEIANVIVENSASVIGKGTLNVQTGALDIKTGTSLTLGENTTIQASTLSFPKGASIIGFSAEKSLIQYISTTAVGGSYEDNVTIQQVVSYI